MMDSVQLKINHLFKVWGKAAKDKEQVNFTKRIPTTAGLSCRSSG